jgi:hypothetical protein
MANWREMILSKTPEQIATESEKATSSKYLEVGEHDVRIIAVEIKDSAKTGLPYLNITLEGLEGGTIKTVLNALQEDGKFSRFFHLFCKQISSLEVITRSEAVRYMLIYPDLIESLIGFQVRVKIELEKKGLTIIRDSDTKDLYFMDVETSKPAFENQSFKTYQEADAFLSETNLNLLASDDVNAIPLKKAYNRVSSYIKMDGAMADQDSVLLSIIEAGKLRDNPIPAKPVAKAMPAGLPRRTI